VRHQPPLERGKPVAQTVSIRRLVAPSAPPLDFLRAIQPMNGTATARGCLTVDGRTTRDRPLEGSEPPRYFPGWKAAGRFRFAEVLGNSGRRLVWRDTAGKSCSFRNEACISCSHRPFASSQQAEVFHNTRCLHGCHLAIPRRAEDGTSRAPAKKSQRAGAIEYAR